MGTIIDLASAKTVCTATLYTKTRAVTAAHCLAGADVSKLAFAVDLDGGRRVVAISSASVHPGFTEGQENSTTDIAFFEVKEPLPVPPIPVTIDGKGLVPGAQTLVVGYGHESVSFDPKHGEVRTGSGVKRAALFTISRVDPIQTIVDAHAHFLSSQPGKPEPARTPVANCASYPEPGGRCVDGEVQVCAETFGGFFVFRVRCDYPQTCGIDPQTTMAQCMLGGSQRTATLALYDQVLVKGALVKGPPLGGHYVFVDPPSGRSIALNPDVPRTDANGRVRITTTDGAHTIKVASPEQMADYTALPEFPLQLDASSPRKSNSPSSPPPPSCASKPRPSLQAGRFTSLAVRI